MVQRGNRRCGREGGRSVRGDEAGPRPVPFCLHTVSMSRPLSGGFLNLFI